ncbi:MAG: type IV pilus secretin PilQ [Legionellaceae bacterium]|nr:type IV pilus secretin PilQ [Legionellaceae bacterium]
MNINLLPWRDNLRIHQSRKLFSYVLIGILFFGCLIFYLEHNSRERISQQTELNNRLKHDIENLQMNYQRSLQDKEKESEIVINEPDPKKQINSHSELIKLNYAKALELVVLLKDRANSFLSERGIIVADSRTNTLWLEDTNEQLQRVKKYIHDIDVPKKQVLIEARLVNMTNDGAEDLGVRFGMLQTNNSLENTNSDQSGSKNTNHLNFDLSALPLDASPASLGIALVTLGKHVLLDMELSAMESEGRAEIIAKPSLLTLNQEAAVIESGEDIPYQEYTASGATSVSFKKAVLSLKVVPQINFDGKLMMELFINQDSDSGRRVQGVPVITTKSIATNVIVGDGETIVLGGIYKQDKNNSIIRVPFLGTLPIVGHLFRRTQARIKNEELLIFITPKILSVKI